MTILIFSAILAWRLFLEFVKPLLHQHRYFIFFTKSQWFSIVTCHVTLYLFVRVSRRFWCYSHVYTLFVLTSQFFFIKFKTIIDWRDPVNWRDGRQHLSEGHDLHVFRTNSWSTCCPVYIIHPWPDRQYILTSSNAPAFTYVLRQPIVNHHKLLFPKNSGLYSRESYMLLM